MRSFSLSETNASANDKVKYQEVLENLENYVINNYLRITPNQAANIIIFQGQNIKNPSLINICEKVISNGIKNHLYKDRIHSLLSQVFMGFKSNKHSSQQILNQLI